LQNDSQKLNKKIVFSGWVQLVIPYQKKTIFVATLGMLGMLREFLGLWQHKKKVWSLLQK
jgi:hypothetical protein